MRGRINGTLCGVFASMALCAIGMPAAAQVRGYGWERADMGALAVGRGETGVMSLPDEADEFVVECEIVFGAKRGHRWRVELIGRDGSPRRVINVGYDTAPLYDGFADSRYVAVSLDSVTSDGCCVPLDCAQLHHDRELYGRSVVLTVSNGSDGLGVWLGSDEGVYAVGGAPMDGIGSLRVGGSNSLQVCDAAVKWRRSPGAMLRTGWMDEAIVADGEAPVGHWRFLDRDTDSRWGEPGGRYTLAVVPHDDRKVWVGDGADYDILYVSGAESNGSHWMPGMLKGHLYRTGFDGYYRAVWYDAWFGDMGDEVSAMVSGGLMEVRFPVYHGLMRFEAVATSVD